MSTAKQVHARSLHVTVSNGVIEKLVHSVLWPSGDSRPANSDTLVRSQSRQVAHSAPIVENASALAIPSHPVRVVGDLLSLTERQREMLRSMAESVTAHEYGRVEGGNLVFVSTSVHRACVTLHVMGFSRECDSGRVASPRFTKALEYSSGRSAAATAGVELNSSTGVVYTRISVD